MIEDILPEKMRRIEISLVNINERIARLCISLGTSVSTEIEMQKILDRETGAFRHDEEAQPLSTATDAERRLQHEWEELRGLLVMRCDLMAHTLDEWGFETTRLITANVEKYLEHQGFKRGADGFYLHRRMNETGES